MILLFIIIFTIFIILFQYKVNKENFESKIFFDNQEIVIARYNEDLSWIDESPFNKHPITIYNKGEKLVIKNSNVKNITDLPNVGREVHTFLYHIIQNYGNLSDVTIFLAGSVKNPHKYERSKKMIEIVEKTNETYISCNHFNVEDQNEFKIDTYLSIDELNKKANKDDKMKKSEIRPFKKWFEHTFIKNEKNKCIAFNSIISVSKQNILQKPKLYYENLLNQVNTHHNHETVHYFERSWYSVFYPYKPKTFHDEEFNDVYYISGRGFAEYSKYVFDDRYTRYFVSKNIQENDTVFVNLDLFQTFLDILKNDPPPKKFILISHNSDATFTEDHYNSIKQYVNKIYAENNIIYNNENVKTIPLGFRDMCSHSEICDTVSTIKKIMNENNNIEKIELVYLNINIISPISSSKRKFCLEYFNSFNWVFKNKGISYEDFYRDLQKSKYVISPEGNGIDCHRIYESLFFDAIPILKRSLLDPFYEKLPVIIVKEWTDINEDFLNTNYNKYYNILINWKKENPNWIYPSYWIT
jgi:hypothetical protein